MLIKRSKQKNQKKKTNKKYTIATEGKIKSQKLVWRDNDKLVFV